MAKWNLEKGIILTQTWTCEWQGHQIKVKNWFTIFLLFTGEQLFVDGALVLDTRHVFSARTASLDHKLPDNTHIHVKIGTLWPLGKIGAKIFVNNELIGGDIKARFKRWWEMCIVCACVVLSLILFEHVGLKKYHSRSNRKSIITRVLLSLEMNQQKTKD